MPTLPSNSIFELKGNYPVSERDGSLLPPRPRAHASLSLNLASEELVLCLLCRETARPPSPWACKGHAQMVRARYLVGGCEQMRQAGTQKRAPVQRRGPHAVRRRRNREQVNQTPEGDRR